jgi:hypothetical protein
MSKSVNTRLGNIRIPFYVMRRGKGHIDVLGNVEVSTVQQSLHIYNIIEVLVGCAKTVWDRGQLVNIVKLAAKAAKVSSLSLDVRFLYSLDRATPTYKSTFFDLSCLYNVMYQRGTISYNMGVEVPARIKMGGGISVGKVKVEVVDPSVRSFEDILDYIQKNAGIRIYPVNSSDDVLKLPEVVDEGMSIEDYFKVLKQSGSKELGKKVTLTVSSTDIYHMYEIERVFIK